MKLKQYISEKIAESAKLLIGRAKEGDFGEWVASKPDDLKKIYRRRRIPSAGEIVKSAETGEMTAVNALEHWEGSKAWKKWKKERW